MATIRNLLTDVESAMVGEPLALDIKLVQKGGSIPILISGIDGDTVVLEATIATQQEVIEDTASWEKISQATWTQDVADGLFTPFTHIRGRVTTWVAGKINMKTIV